MQLKACRIFATVALLGAASTSVAIDDTPENRAAQIARYLNAIPPAEIMRDMADALSANLPPTERAGFREVMTQHIDVELLTATMTTAMAKHFTADELAALADFYGSPTGKSAVKKMGAYTAEIMPVVQAEVMRAFGEAQAARAAANRQLPDDAE
jgi:hypothetical protein